MARRMALHLEQSKHEFPRSVVPNAVCQVSKNGKGVSRLHTDSALKASWNARFNFRINRLDEFGLVPISHEDLCMLRSSVMVVHIHPFSEAIAKSDEESGWESTIQALEPLERGCNRYGGGGREIGD